MKVDGWSRLTRVITTLQNTSINVIKRKKREEYQNVSNEDLQSDEEEDNKEESENEDENKVKATEEEGDKSISVNNELDNSTKDRDNVENENRTHSNEATCKNEEGNKHNTFHYPSYLNKCLNYEDYLYPTNELPKSFEEALESPEKEEWQAAMKKEIDNLINNDAFILTTLPEDQKLIDGEWVYSYKQHPTNGRLTRTARYVAKGSTQQQYGVDYIDTHSPTLKMASLRLLMQVAAEKGLIVHHLDVKTACLNAPIDRDVYVTQPKGFEGQSPENNESKEGNDPDDLKKQSKGNDQTKSRKQGEYSEPRQNRDKYGYYYVSRGYRVYEDNYGRRRYRRHRVYKDDKKYERSEYEYQKEDYQGNRNLDRNQNVHDDPRRNRGHEKGSKSKLVNRDANKNENKEKKDENEESKEEQTPENDNRVWKLKKTIYGLKQSKRNWNGHLKTVMEEKGFKRSTVDPCVYRFKASPELIAFLLFWNDDVITAASTKELLEEVKEFLKEKLRMNDLGPISWFLGIEFKQYKNFEIGMTQERYLEGVLKKFNKEEGEVRSTPCDETILHDESNEEKSFLEENIPQSRYLKEIWAKYGVEEYKLSSTICNAIQMKKNGERGTEDKLMNCNAIRTKKDGEDEDCEKIKTHFFGRVKTRFGIHRTKYSPVNISSTKDEEEPTRYSLFNASPSNEDEANHEDESNNEEDNNEMNNENREDISNVDEGTPQHSDDEISLQEENESEMDENISLANEEEKTEVVDDEKKFYKEINGEIFSIVEYDDDENDENGNKDELLKEESALDIENKEKSKNKEQFEDETEGSGELEQERENEENLNSEEHLEIEEQEKDDTNNENDDDNKNNNNDKNTENGDEDKEKTKNDYNNENDENVGNTENLENAENEVPSIEEKTLTEKQKNKFREILASLTYAMQATRPDLTWVVTKLSQHLACPKQPDLDIIKQILQYIKGTITYRMTFRKSKQGLKLIGYSDAEWSGGMGGRILHRSISGYCFTVNKEDGPVISWDSTLQMERALSPCEAGFLSLTTATREARFLKSLAKEFDITCNEPVNVLSGNQNSISLLKGPTIKANSKCDVTTKWKNMTQQTKAKRNNKMNWKKMTHDTMLKTNDVKYHLTRDRLITKGVDVSCILPNDNIAHVMCGIQSTEQLNELHKHLFGKP